MQIWQITPWIEMDLILRLIAATLISALIGYERERAEKPAGFRTHILVGMGAALFTIASLYGFGGLSDPSRVAAGIVVGIGFLGAGTILRRETSIVGLTTAASIWIVAAIGMAMGSGLYIIGLVAAVIVLVVLRFPQ